MSSIQTNPLYLLNAFSVNQLGSFPAAVKFTEQTVSEVQEVLAEGYCSAVGHGQTAEIFSRVLQTTIPVQRITIELHPGDRAVLGQYRGPRLEEGARQLPDGARIHWYLVEIGG
ncbi:MAG: DUF1874 domain-containing protein [Candidatus Hydrogenedens sp.]|jgi:hypothetical protein|nr:DUF1874 domain-containing protein [Candidatus Hydrogenedens sp.]